MAPGTNVNDARTGRFARFIGVIHEPADGGTADLRRTHGGGAGDTRVVAGV